MLFQYVRRLQQEKHSRNVDSTSLSPAQTLLS